LRWALARGVPVGFADLPATHALALEAAAEAAPTVEPEPADGPDDDDLVDPPSVDPPSDGRAGDVIGALARAGGYDDPESWWEDAVEHRHGEDPRADLAAVVEAVGVFRTAHPTDDETMLRREAAMRRVLRATMADAGDDGRVVFVCGAYHAPVLHPDAWPTLKSDDALLRKLPKVKVEATWSPWTSRRLAFASGYGAGVASPGWYAHLFTTPEDTVVEWMVKVARSLREEQHHASAASAVEAARLADALAALRGRPRAGLSEVHDAARTVLCEGSELPLRLVVDRLVVGHGLGAVPDETPLVPLARDLAAQQRRLRLTPSAEQKVVTLDLREEGPRSRSVLLHRLTLLGVPWGVPADAGRTKGTFKEAWQLEWRPELDVELIVAAMHGTTVTAAAEAKAAADAAAADDLASIAALVEACLLADLPDGVASVLDVLARRTALQHDAQVLMVAVEPLARTYRYGDVREVDTSAIGDVLDVLVTRAALGLPNSVASLDDDHAAELRDAIEGAHRGMALLGGDERRDLWLGALGRVAEQDGVHGSVQGRVVRLLLDADRVALDDVRGHLGRALSSAADPSDSAAWLDGFLAGEALLLLHDPHLLGLIDEWVGAIRDETFDEVLPLLRRTFSRYEPAERRHIGEALGRGPRAAGDVDVDDDDVDVERAAPAVAAVAALLGVGA